MAVGINTKISNMKTILSLLLFLFVINNSIAQDNFVGVWVNELDKEEIEIYKKGDYYYAKANNSKDTIMVLIQMVYKSDFKLYGGTYVDSKSKDETEAKVEINKYNELTIIIIHRENVFNRRRKYIKQQIAN